MKVWITKYALTSGIEEVEAEMSETCPTMIEVPTQSYSPYYHKPFWHCTRQEAINHAEELKAKKVQSLRKAIANLESLRF